MSEGQTKSTGLIVALIVGAVGIVLVGVLVVVGLFMALLLPAVQKVRSAANNMQSANNLKVVGIAMHEYATKQNGFPLRAIYDKDGKPLLSWRVALLPYLGESDLYQQFHLDEPWDSPHNKALLPAMPEFYLLPSGGDAGPGMTHYQAVVGKGTMFEMEKKEQGIRMTGVPDGLSNTALIVEAANAVPWTKPEDYVFDPAAVIPPLGAGGKEGFNVLFGDGSVKRFRLKDSNSAETKATLRRLFLRNDGEAIDFSVIEQVARPRLRVGLRSNDVRADN